MKASWRSKPSSLWVPRDMDWWGWGGVGLLVVISTHRELTATQWSSYRLHGHTTVTFWSPHDPCVTLQGPSVVTPRSPRGSSCPLHHLTPLTTYPPPPMDNPKPSPVVLGCKHGAPDLSLQAQGGDTAQTVMLCHLAPGRGHTATAWLNSNNIFFIYMLKNRKVGNIQ